MDPKRKLKGMLARIFSDANADPHERAELKTWLSTCEMPMAEIKEVFEDFVATTWKITMADGVVTDQEKKRLLEIVDVLALEIDVLPTEWAQIITDSKN